MSGREVIPCPFCGGGSHVVREMNTGHVSMIVCEECGVEVYSGRDSIDTVDVLWNRREQDELMSAAKFIETTNGKEWLPAFARSLGYRRDPIKGDFT
jgi:Lar family restriction alleviation protein